MRCLRLPVFLSEERLQLFRMTCRHDVVYEDGRWACGLYWIFDKWTFSISYTGDAGPMKGSRGM